VTMIIQAHESFDLETHLSIEKLKVLIKSATLFASFDASISFFQNYQLESYGQNCTSH